MLNTIEVATYLKGLFERTCPELEFEIGVDVLDSFEVRHKGKWAATFDVPPNGISKWVMETIEPIDLMSEDEIIAQIKEWKRCFVDIGP